MAHDLRLTDLRATALGLTDVSAPAASGGCGCGGGTCACGHHGAGHHASADHGAHTEHPSTVSQGFEVNGMTCEHCVSSVTEELAALGGVERVDVDLLPGAASTVTVTADRALTRDEIRAAVEDAGYTLAH